MIKVLNAKFEKLLGSDCAGKRQRVRTMVDAIVTSSNLESVLNWKGINRLDHHLISSAAK